jgi:hypothetical protein
MPSRRIPPHLKPCFGYCRRINRPSFVTKDNSNCIYILQLMVMLIYYCYSVFITTSSFDRSGHLAFSHSELIWDCDYYGQTVGLPGRGINPSQDLYLHRATQTEITLVFEPTISVFDGKATVIGFVIKCFPQIPSFSLFKTGVRTSHYQKRTRAATFTRVLEMQVH